MEEASVAESHALAYRIMEFFIKVDLGRLRNYM
jgi:hypothetical protein